MIKQLQLIYLDYKYNRENNTDIKNDIAIKYNTIAKQLEQ